MTVAAYLAQSRQAHTRYRRLHADTQGANLPAMAAAVTEALTCRLDADALDPDHHDPAWADDAIATKASHDALVTFYGRYLTPPEAFA